MCGLCHGFGQAVEYLNSVLGLMCLFSNEVLDTGFNIFHSKSPIFVDEVFFGVPEESAIMMIFAPVYIDTDCLSLSDNFSLNRWMDLDSLSKSSGILRIALLDSLMPVVEV